MTPTHLRRCVVFFGCATATCLLHLRQLRAEPSALEPVLGYNRGLQETPRSLALGGALHALSNSTDAVYLNPANIASSRVYHLAGAAQIWPQAGRQTYGGAAVDSAVNPQRLAGGVAANWTRQDPDGVDRRVFDFRFGLAAPLSDSIFIGGDVRYLNLSQTGFPRDGSGLPPSMAAAGLSDMDIVEEVTFDAGLTVKPVDELAISVVGSNLTDVGHSFLPFLLGGGVGYGNEVFSVEADIMADLTTYERTSYRYMGGVEFLAGGAVPLRVGYRHDDGEESDALSAGVGYTTREFSVDGGIRSNISGASSMTLVFGFRYHLDAAGLVGGN